jgi:hypothetical protein
MRGQAKRTLIWRVCRRTLVRSSDDTDWDSNRLSGHKALELDAAFVVPLSVLAYTGLTGDLVMEPGPIELSAGSSSDDLRSKATLTVTGKTRTIRGEDRKFFSVTTVGS